MPLDAILLVIVTAGAAAVAGVIYGSRLARRSPPVAAPVEERADKVDPPTVNLSHGLGPADHLGFGLLRIDADGRIGEANRSAERLLRSSPGSLVGRSTIEAFVDHDVEGLAVRARRDGHARGEYMLPIEPQVTLSVHAWRADEDSVWMALEDVSELRRLRRIRTEFIDNLSHELRTPLTTVRLLTESLSIEAERTELPPRMRDSISKIDVETGHLVQMVNEILELSRIEGGATEMQIDDVEVGSLIDGALDRLRTFADRQGVVLEAELSPDDRRLIIRGDEEQLGQVLINLLHNAVKFSPDGGSVVVSAERDGELCALTVTDEGEGIPRADVGRVFERFYKADKARHRGRGGTGLGLSIARHIVEGHGGRITVDSVEGHGSKFRFTIPLAPSDGI